MFYGGVVRGGRYTGRKGGFPDLLVFDFFLKLLSEELPVLKVLLQLGGLQIGQRFGKRFLVLVAWHK